MRNLFVLHTQYNLLLAIGLCQRCFRQDQNDLILFQDFNISDIHNKAIKTVFLNNAILCGNYMQQRVTYFEKNRIITRQNKKIGEFIEANGKYDRLFIVEDMCIPEMFAMKCAFLGNNQIEMNWLEDGAIAYFDNDSASYGMGATPTRRLLRKLFFSIKFNLWGFYYLGGFMGSNPRLAKVYVLFPQSIREELKNREIIEITQEAFEDGMNTLFKSDPILIHEGSIMLVLDKLSVYGECLNDVEQYVCQIVKNAHVNGNKVYYKYHPKETQCLKILETEIEMDKKIAFEAFLTNSTSNKVTIIGFKSTALQSAKKMGYKTESYIQKLEPNNTKISEFYESIGIICK